MFPRSSSWMVNCEFGLLPVDSLYITGGSTGVPSRVCRASGSVPAVLSPTSTGVWHQPCRNWHCCAVSQKLCYNGEQVSPSFSATSVAMVCWTLHYAKRLLETLFVHRFSHATMPLRNLFKVRTTHKLRLLSIMFLTELQLLLGVYSFCFLLHQPPSLHTSW